MMVYNKIFKYTGWTQDYLSMNMKAIFAAKNAT